MAMERHIDAGQDNAGDVGSVEELIPLPKRVVLGAQQALVSNAWLDPIFIASVAGFSAGLATNLVSATFLAAGIVTFVQSTKLVRLPIVQGPSSAFSPLAIGYYKAGTIASAGLGLFIGAALVFLAAISGQFARIRTVLSKSVSGAIITLVGISLTGFAFMEFFGGPGSPDFGTGHSLLIASLTMGAVVVCSGLGGRFRTFGFLIGLVVGNVAAAVAGLLDYGGVGAAPWLALPKLLPYGAWSFDLGITLTMVIVFFVAVVEAVGMYEATALLTRTPLTDRRINMGIAGEAGGSMLSALMGAFGTTAYAQNLGVVKLTGVASRHVVRVTGIIFIILAFIPKVGAILVATPAPVIGGLFIPAAATVIMAGIQMAGIERHSPARNLVAPLGIMAGLGVPPLADALAPSLHPVLAEMAHHSIVVGSVVAILAELVLVQLPRALGATADERGEQAQGGKD
ncbi:uracil-xanthine permease family protein [Paracoccus aminovorans]|uniref:uracil-xanthine permease family protein n=1 Tax=Paracoccus aminovorans TaxID=34004 RepID=UPI002B25E821|nr:solute carrier family 23 protein [Paracoccus aminovorans]